MKSAVFVHNDPPTIAAATNYFTVLGVHQWAWKKGHVAFEKARQHWPITTPWIDYADDVALVLGIDTTVWQKMYHEVERGFKMLPSDTYVIQRGQSLYPRLLHAVPDAPEFLFMRGHVEFGQQPIISVVGTRQPSDDGIRKAQTLTKLLGQYHMVVASGLAKGIDRAAHEAALDNRIPTIAVIGTPVNKTYPKEHQRLQAMIAEQGLIISQFHPAAPIHRWNFPYRNAVMSGISLATVVVEAGETSGALIQADYALKQGRLVFVPQSAVENPMLQWPRRYVNEKGAHSFRRIDELIGALSNARILPSYQKESDEETVIYVSER